jgi:mitogen-activated protein kinase 1/3
LLRELRILRVCGGHPNVVGCVDVLAPRSFVEFRDLYLVFEFVDTDLQKLIASNQ